MKNYTEKIAETAEYLTHQLTIHPKRAIILGSGLGDLVNRCQQKQEFKYNDIPHFPLTTVKGHGGRLIFGTLQDQPVLLMDGRFHYYEGYSMKQIAFPIYVMKALGIEELFITNSCGAINPSFQPGDIVLINDFISLVSDNPLIGVNDESLGPRFVDMTEPYHPQLLDRAKKVAKMIQFDLKQGVYGFFQGPYYETKAEIKAFGLLGCDLIGMSTVPETIAANHCGLKVVALSAVTNMATGLQDRKHSHDLVVEKAQKTSIDIIRIIEGMLLECK